MYTFTSLRRYMKYKRYGGYVMTILDNMRLVKNELFNKKHPFAKEAVQFRQMYVIGYAMLVCVNGYPSEMAKEVLKKQVALLDLPIEFKKVVINIAIQADVEMIHKVLQSLSAEQHKYVFMLDLYQFAQNDHKITEKEQELLLLFEELLQLNYSEVQFIRSFRLAMLRNDIELASKAVQAAFEQNVAVPVEALSFFLPQFVYQEKWGQTTLLSGNKRKLGFATLLSGELIVSKGAELDLNGMEVTFADNASIIVDGGVLKADGVRFVASMDANRTMLSIRNTGMLKISNAQFFGANNVRAIEMNNAKVELEGCSFEKCFDEERGGAVYFANSDHFVVKNCMFEHNSTLGKGGCMYIAGTEASHMRAREFFSRITGKEKKVQLVMEGCRFKESRADIAGALYIYDADILLQKNTFTECSSSLGGAAIDMLNCQLTAKENQFTNCKAAPDSAIVVLGGDKLENEEQIGKFEQCEPLNIKVK